MDVSDTYTSWYLWLCHASCQLDQPAQLLRPSHKQSAFDFVWFETIVDLEGCTEVCPLSTCLNCLATVRANQHEMMH